MAAGLDAGLCERCRWAGVVTSGKGSRFLRCGLSDRDARFARYPSLPVRACEGFEAAPPSTPDGSLLEISLAAAEPGPARDAQGRTLFERLGGREAVERLVDTFYDYVEQDPELRPIFPAELGPGREKQKLFLEQWLGGEPRYSQRYGHPRLRLRHFPFVISERAAGRWLQHMGRALRECGVADYVAAEIMEGLGPLARQMVNEGERRSQGQRTHGQRRTCSKPS